MDARTLRLFSKAEEAALVVLAAIIVLLAFMGGAVLLTTALSMATSGGSELSREARAILDLPLDYYRTAFSFITLLAILVILMEAWTARKRLELAAARRDLGRLVDMARGAVR